MYFKLLIIVYLLYKTIKTKGDVYMKGVFEYNEKLANKVVKSIELLKDDKKKELKLSALSHLINVNRPYDEGFEDNAILVDLYIKKIDFILKANTKKEIEEILSVSHIKFNGGEIIPTKYNIIEEELLMWSLTSLKSPLSNLGQNRYMELFKQYYGQDFYDKISK